MREIKFRVWNKNKKRMKTNSVFLLISAIEAGRLDKNQFVIMQYTGLKDKNGVEIYEGDVIKFHTGDICEVVFTGGSFEMISRVGKNKGKYFVFPRNKDIDELSEVIGNIFENQELLEQAE